MLKEFIANLLFFYKEATFLIDKYDIKKDVLLMLPNMRTELFKINETFNNNEFISYETLDFISQCYDTQDIILQILETRFFEYESNYNNLIQYNKVTFDLYDYFDYYLNKYTQHESEFLEFLKWACLREQLIFPYTYYYYYEAFKNAKLDYNNISYYLKDKLKEAYFYNLALHNIITSPDDSNMLFKKYNINLYALGFINSSSDSISSVSINTPTWVQDASLSDSILTQTPYGLEVLKVRSQLNNVVVCI